MGFDEFVKFTESFFYNLFEDTIGLGSNARITPYGEKVIANYHAAEREIMKKLSLIDSSLLRFPVDHILKYSLKDLERAIEDNDDKDNIRKMINKNWDIIRILRPYENFLFLIDQKNPIYSKEYEQKYNELKINFLKAA